MEKVSIRVEQFEGPLDLLLHLIHENKYDIFDIPIVEITDQYMAALNEMQEFDMEVATEFLLMAATLLQIKSRLLLPKLRLLLTPAFAERIRHGRCMIMAI